jgi:hypothetical protein
MVVVNDATHLIDQGPVGVSVLSTRPTSQGVMVFAKLADDPLVNEPEVDPPIRSVRSRGSVLS